jgi:hypothetical protein
VNVGVGEQQGRSVAELASCVQSFGNVANRRRQGNLILISLAPARLTTTVGPEVWPVRS